MKDTSSQQEFENLGPTLIQQADLPLSCPLPDKKLWNAHPRVYLPIEETGQATCPYCGAQYILKDFEDPPLE